jgi:hypothetical protein
MRSAGRIIIISYYWPKFCFIYIFPTFSSDFFVCVHEILYCVLISDHAYRVPLHSVIHVCFPLCPRFRLARYIRHLPAYRLPLHGCKSTSCCTTPSLHFFSTPNFYFISRAVKPGGAALRYWLYCCVTSSPWWSRGTQGIWWRHW